MNTTDIERIAATIVRDYLTEEIEFGAVHERADCYDIPETDLRAIHARTIELLKAVAELASQRQPSSALVGYIVRAPEEGMELDSDGAPMFDVISYDLHPDIPAAAVELADARTAYPEARVYTLTEVPEPRCAGCGELVCDCVCSTDMRARIVHGEREL